MNQGPKSLLARAIEIAASAHACQYDKGGAAYVLHPLRMMMRQRSDAAMIAAVLHDVVEDAKEAGWTLDRLRDEGFSEEVVTAVDCLSKRSGEEYPEFIARANANPIAREVKLADLEDNMDLTRIPTPGDEDFGRLAKYRESWETLKRIDVQV